MFICLNSLNGAYLGLFKQQSLMFGISVIAKLGFQGGAKNLAVTSFLSTASVSKKGFLNELSGKMECVHIFGFVSLKHTQHYQL